MKVLVTVPYTVLVEVEVEVDDDLTEGQAWAAAQDEAEHAAQLYLDGSNTIRAVRPARVERMGPDWTDVEFEVLG